MSADRDAGNPYEVHEVNVLTCKASRYRRRRISNFVKLNIVLILLPCIANILQNTWELMLNAQQVSQATDPIVTQSYYWFSIASVLSYLLIPNLILSWYWLEQEKAGHGDTAYGGGVGTKQEE